jgi:hypothetical protein
VNLKEKEYVGAARVAERSEMQPATPAAVPEGKT